MGRYGESKSLHASPVASPWRTGSVTSVNGSIAAEQNATRTPRFNKFAHIRKWHEGGIRICALMRIKNPKCFIQRATMGEHYWESVAIQKSQPSTSVAFITATCMSQHWQSTVVGNPQNPAQSGISPMVAVGMKFDAPVWIGHQRFSKHTVSLQESLRYPQKRCCFQL